MKIDNFALTNWQTCPAKFKEAIEDSWQPRMKSAALGFGAVVHEGLAEWYRGNLEGLSNNDRLARAILKMREKWPAEHPVDDHRNLNKAEQVMVGYAEEYPGENFKILQVEIPFTLSLGLKLNWCPACHQFNADDWIESFDICAKCGADLEWIEYGGIVDAITEFTPVIYPLEHKTTSQLGSLYFRQYETSNQVTGYCWAVKQLSGKRVAGAIINAICVTRGGKIEYKRETTNRNEADFDLWRRMVQSECNSIARHRATGIWPYRTEQCLGKYGLCAYHSIHTLSTPVEMQRRRESDFEQRKWDHELRDVQVESGT